MLLITRRNSYWTFALLTYLLAYITFITVMKRRDYIILRLNVQLHSAITRCSQRLSAVRFWG